MFAIGVLISILTTAIACTLPESIEIRKFSLITSSGQNVFQVKFFHNTLEESLGLNFHAIGKKFVFKLQRTSVFGSGAVIENVRGQT